MSSEALIDGAGIDPAMPHHHAVGRRDAREAVGVAESDAIGEMAQRRRHAAVHILRVGETAERAGLPFRRIDPPRRLERAFVLAATGRQLAASEMEVAAKIVNLGQRAIVEVCDRQRLRLGQRGKRVVEARDEAIGGGPADAAPRRRSAACDARRQRAVVGLERFGAASCVLLQIPEMQGKVDDVAILGRERQSARRQRDGLIGPEERPLHFGRLEIGPRRLGVSGAVQMLRAQDRIVDEDRGGGFVQFSPSRMGERAVDAVAHQGVSELEAVPDRPQENVSHQRVAGVARLLQQRPEMGAGEKRWPRTEAVWMARRSSSDKRSVRASTTF